MNSIHDMGGMHGFGKVEPEANEPVFHHDWEGRVMALYRAMGFARLWTIDAGRAMIEALPAQTYLVASYYEKWLMGLEKSVERVGLVGADEIAAQHSLRPAPFATQVMSPADVAHLKRADYMRPAPMPARFKVGDRVRTANINPATHTRLPRYARHKCGRIEAVRGCYVFPDTAAIGAGEEPQWLYTVVFSARELWGDAADPALTVSIEAFEPYLLPE
jgi:nitrile hydratase subunit beta